MAIKRRGDRFEVVVYVGRQNGKRVDLSETVHGTEKDARVVEARLITKAAEGRAAVELAHHTVSDLLDKWLELHRTKIEPNTYDGYERLIRLHLKPAFGSRKVTKVETEDIDDLYVAMRDGSAGGSVRQAHTVLNQAFRQAEIWKWRQRHTNPVVDASPSSAGLELDEEEGEPPPVAEVVALLNAAEKRNPEFAMCVFLAAVTGARRGELCGFRLDDYLLNVADDLAAGGSLAVHRVIQVSKQGTRVKPYPKRRKARRRIAVDPVTAVLLERHFERMAARATTARVALVANHWLFSAATDGSSYWNPALLTEWFQSLRDSLGFTWRMHDLRHFSATQLLAAGFDVRMVSGRHGWADATMPLNRYGHFMPASDQSAAAHLGNMLAGALDVAEIGPGDAPLGDWRTCEQCGKTVEAKKYGPHLAGHKWARRKRTAV